MRGWDLVISRVSSSSCILWHRELVTGQKEARPVPDGREGVCSVLSQKSLAEVLVREGLSLLWPHTIRAEVTQKGTRHVLK